MSPLHNDINHDLLVKYLLGEASAEEQAAVRQWMAASPENERAFLQLQTLWEESRRLAAARTPDTDAAWLRMKSRLQETPATSGAVVPMRRISSWLRVAALFILLAGGLWWWQATQQEAPVQSLAVQTTAAPQTDTLPDGSVVTLNKNSRLTYPSRFKGDTRTIALKGEAFFEVTPNKAQPFIINVNDVTVRVVGTSFNVRSVNGTTEVIVETGIVQVIRKGKVAELKPGESIVVTPKDTVLQKAPIEDALYNYYRTRTFVCDNTPLWKLVNILNEAYDANIVIGRRELRNLPLTATFNNESLQQVLQVISETFSIEVVQQEKTIILQ